MFNTGFPPEWSTLKKLIWLVGSGIAGAAKGIWKTVTGTLIHLTDALASPMQKCEVALEPIQDLNGQDAPYPAGGGKNKFDIDNFWENGTTYTSSSEKVKRIAVAVPANTTVTCSTNCPNNTNTSVASVFCNNVANDTMPSSSNAGVFLNTPRTLTSDANGFVYVNIRIQSGSYLAWDETSFAPYYIQVELGSTATPFAPYSNICPITGWTGCKVTRTGVNLVNVADKITPSGYNHNIITDVDYLAGKTVTLSGYLYAQTTNNYASAQWRAIYTQNGTTKNSMGTGTRVSCNDWEYAESTFTLPADATDIKFADYRINGNVTAIGYKQVQLELDSSATSYETFQGNTYSVTFPDGQTVYGGEYDFISGGLKPYKEYDSYNGETLTGRWMSSMDKYVSGTTPTIGAQVVDLDGFETTVQLTPQPISTLAGENNVWGDGTIEMTYKAQAE